MSQTRAQVETLKDTRDLDWGEQQQKAPCGENGTDTHATHRQLTRTRSHTWGRLGAICGLDADSATSTEDPPQEPGLKVGTNLRS